MRPALLQSLKLISYLALFILLPLTAAHAEYEAGKRAFEAGDYATAWRELLPAQSEPHAAVALGFMAEYGLGTKQDLAAAARFYESGVQLRMVPAMVSLGVMYDQGRGVKRDGAAAQRLFLMAATAIATSNNDNNAAADQTKRVAKSLLAFLWARQGGLLNEALCLSAQIIAEEPHNPWYYDIHGLVLLRMKQFDQAEQFFKQSLSEKALPATFEHMGDLAHARGQDDVARDWWQKALEQANNPGDVARLMAKSTGRPDDFGAHPAFELKDAGLGKDCAKSQM